MQQLSIDFFRTGFHTLTLIFVLAGICNPPGGLNINSTALHAV